MWKNLLASVKSFFLIAVFFTAAYFLPAQADNTSEARWYRSNSSGMTLELIPSRIAAMRNEHSLSVRSASANEIPQLIMQYYNAAYRIELSTLYHWDRPIRYQWVFRDLRGVTRLTASGSGSMFAVRGSGALPPGESDENISNGIVELRNIDGDVTREFQYVEDLSEWDFRYFYRNNVLTRAEIWFKEPPASGNAPAGGEENQTPQQAPAFNLMFTDLYRYTRSGSIRAIDRTLHERALEQLRIGFPRLGPGVSFGEELISQVGAYSAEYFAGTQGSEDLTINYDIDNRGRVQAEVWRGDDGEILGELVNTWVGDRLQSVVWKAADDERLIEFEYDNDGNRISEKYFRNGLLERSVVAQGGQEVEELYMSGRLVLRAIWENGVKISEERISPAGRRP